MVRVRVLPSPSVPGSVWAVVVAAGSGRRFGSQKQFAALGGGTVLDRAVAVAGEVVDGVVAVVPADRADERPRSVAGGGTRRRRRIAATW